MTADSSAVKLRVPIFYLRLIQFLWVACAVALLFRLTWSVEHPIPLALLAISLLAMAWGIQSVVRGLKQRMFWAWVVSLILAGMGVPGLLLPLAGFALYRLLQSPTRQAFLAAASEPKHLDMDLCPECARSVLSFSDYAGTYYCECGWSQKSPERRTQEKRQMLGKALSRFAMGFAMTVIALGMVYFKSPQAEQSLAWLRSLTAPAQPKQRAFQIDEVIANYLRNVSNQEIHRLRQGCLEDNDLGCLVAIYSEMALREPGNITWPANLAMRLTDLGYHNQAIKIYEELVTGPEATYDIMAFYAMSLQKMGNHEQAVEWFNKSLAIEPKLTDVTRQLAISLIELDRSEEAAEKIREFIRMVPSSKGYFRDLQLYQKASALK